MRYYGENRGMKNRLIQLLRWSERYTQTDMVYLAHGGFWLGVNQGALIVIGFGTAVLFARFLPAEQYGNFKYVLSLASLIGAFSFGAMGTAVTRAASLGNDRSLVQGFITILQWSYIMVGIAGVGAIYYYTNGNYNLAIALLLIASTSPLLTAAALYDPYLENKQLFDVKTRYGFFRNMLPAIAVAATILVTDEIIPLLLVYFISNTITVWWVYHHTVRHYVVSHTVDPDLARYGGHLSIMNLISVVAGNIDKILIFQLMGGTPLAIYAFAQAPISYLQTSTQMIKTLVLPKFATQSIATLRKGVFRKGVQIFLISAVIAGTYVLLAPWFFGVFFPTYADSVIYSQILVLTLLFTPSIFPAQAILAHQKTYELYLLRTAPPVVKMLCIVILIPLYGLWGAIFSLLISKVFETILVFVIFAFLKDT